MAENSVTAEDGARFRRNEIANRLRSLADLFQMAGLPVPRFDRTPLLEFQLATEAEVDHVARALGYRPRRFRSEYFTGIDNAELRVRWTATVATEGTDFDRSQTADADETPLPVAGRRHESHAGAVTDEGLVDETP